MKLITYQLPGDSVETAHRLVHAGIFKTIESLDDAESEIRKYIPAAEIITYTDITKEEFCKLPADTILRP